MPLGRSGVRCPLTPQCRETSWLGRGDQDTEKPTWSRCRPARSSARRVAGAVTAPTRTFCCGEPGVRPPPRRRCGYQAGGGGSWPSLLRVPAVSGCPASGTGLGAEFASHLKVARNWDPPNPRALARSAGAVRPRRGRGEVREANACPLKWRYVCDLRLAAFRRVAVQFRKVKEWVEATKMLGQGEEKREEFWTPAFQGSSVASPHAAFSPR